MNFNEDVKYCPICEREHPDTVSSCQCGYNFDKDEIEKDRINIKGSWSKQIIQKKNVHAFQLRKRRGWTQQKTADLISVHKSGISQDLALAEALEAYPQLRKCGTKKEAVSRLREIQGANEKNKFAFDEEVKLKHFLKDNWQKTPLAKEWELKECEYNTHTVGRIDLLACHKKDKKWLVIELKLSKSSDETVGQLLRYMGWVELNYASKVEGLIIANTIDEQTYCSLKCVPNIQLKLYKIENDQFYLEDYGERLLIFKSLSPKNREMIVKALKEKKVESSI